MSEFKDVAANIRNTKVLHGTYNNEAKTTQQKGLSFEGIVTGNREVPVTMTGSMSGPHSTFGS